MSSHPAAATPSLDPPSGRDGGRRVHGDGAGAGAVRSHQGQDDVEAEAFGAADSARASPSASGNLTRSAYYKVPSSSKDLPAERSTRDRAIGKLRSNSLCTGSLGLQGAVIKFIKVQGYWNCAMFYFNSISFES